MYSGIVRSQRAGVLWSLAVFSAVGLTYANHFHNGFHFDDSHAVTGNAAIRNITNLPRFFTDASTSSRLPTHQAWRPLVTASLALDYRLGRGYEPFYFQLSTFAWFLAQLSCMYLWFAAILRRVLPGHATAAWLAVAVYGLHPAMAETVNYIIQRAEVISTCGVVAGLAIYARFPGSRRYGIYLAPIAAGLLAKPPALVFPLLFIAHEFWCEEKSTGLLAAVRKTLPSFALAAVFAALQIVMTPKTLVTGGSAYTYWITQPYVALRYFTSFFLPLHLNADTDLAPFRSVWSPQVLSGVVFVGALIYVIRLCSHMRSTRPIAFGLAWFLAALIPTSIFPLAEVENDHRMFFPFVGLALALMTAVALFLRAIRRRGARVTVAAALACLLLPLALATRQRNEVWRTDESLWRDVTIKSPRNGRGWMNYGVSQMSAGHLDRALESFNRAATLLTNYPWLEINLGIAHGALHHDAEAAAHFRRALAIDPRLADAYSYYARWLRSEGHADQAAALLESAAAVDPSFRSDAQFQQ